MKLHARRPGAWGRLAGGALVGALTIAVAWPAGAGEVATAASRAEQLAASGDAQGAVAALDEATDALWRELPLTLRKALFAETGSIKAFGKYTPRASAFRPGETATIYLEPVGYGFAGSDEAVAINLETGLEIRSPGGIVYARAPAFGELTWQGRARSREIHANVSVALPDLSPGDYEMVVTVTDRTTGKAAETTLPFAIAD